MAKIILQSSSPKSEAWDAIHFETVLEVIAVEPLHITRLSSQFLFSTSNYQDTLSDERGGLIGSSRLQARTREYYDTRKRIAASFFVVNKHVVRRRERIKT